MPSVLFTRLEEGVADDEVVEGRFEEVGVAVDDRLVDGGTEVEELLGFGVDAALEDGSTVDEALFNVSIAKYHIAVLTNLHNTASKLGLTPYATPSIFASAMVVLTTYAKLVGSFSLKERNYLQQLPKTEPWHVIPAPQVPSVLTCKAGGAPQVTADPAALYQFSGGSSRQAPTVEVT